MKDTGAGIQPDSDTGVKILALADLHGSQAAVEHILDAATESGTLDVIVLAGDLTRFFTPDQLGPVMRPLLRTGKPVLAVAGNCDGPAVHDEIARLGCSIGGRGEVVAGVGFCGVPSAPPHRGHTWEVEEAQLAAWLERGYGGIRDQSRKVLVTHAPPSNIPDGTPGSTAIADAVTRLDFDLVICGHIHEAHGVSQVAGRKTQVVNCGCAADGRYALVHMSPSRVLVTLR